MQLLQADEIPERVLVVVAHPDDIDFGTAGTAAVLTQAGSEVVYACCTSGEAGIPEHMERDELASLREKEQRAAAGAVGVNDVRFLGMPDGHLEYNLELRAAISRLIRQVKPDVVITQSPERNYDSIFSSHPDHLAAANATIAAVYPDSRNPHAHPHLLEEGHEPHEVEWIWIGRGTEPNLAVDITKVIKQKAAALSRHESQVGSMENIEGVLTDWARSSAAQFGVEDQAELVEVFRRVKAN